MHNPFLQHLSRVCRPFIRKTWLADRVIRSGSDQQLGMYSNRNSPPDLDELWRQFTQRLSTLLARNPRNKLKKTFNIRPPAKPSARHIAYCALGASCAALGFWIGSGFYTVSLGDAAVLFQWGRYQETITAQGFHWHLPYPMQSNENVDISGERIVKVESDKLAPSTYANTSALLQERDPLSIRATVRYKIQDAAAYLLNNANPEAALAQATRSALRSVPVQNKADNTAPNRPATLAPAVLTKSVQSQLDAYKTGIQISTITLENIGFPDALQSVLEEDARKILEERDRQKNRVLREAKEALAQARTEISQLEENAQRYAWRAMAQAKADAESFKRLLPIYAKAPSVVRDRLYREMFQDIYSKVPKVWANGVQAGGADKNLLSGPVIALSIQAPSTGIPAPSTLKSNSEQNGNRPTSTSPGETPSSGHVEQGISRNNAGSFTGNALFPYSRDSLRERERDA